MATDFSRMSSGQLLAYLTESEVDGRRAPDCRRMLRDERQRLQLALRKGSRREIGRAHNEAARVAAMWEGF